MDKVEQLIKKLEEGMSYEREGAAERLGEMRDTRAVEPLCRALGDWDPEVRRIAAEALGEIPDVRAIAPLKPLVPQSRR